MNINENSEISEYKNAYTLISERPYLKGKLLVENNVDFEHNHIAQSSTDTSICNAANRGKVAIFIDGSNLFYAALQLNIEIDYTKLLCYLTKGAQLLRAFFYTGVDRSNDKQQGFLLWMRRNGYRVVTKDLVQLPDGSKKANLDVEIAVDMMNLAPHYNTAVLVSGDGDLAYAVNAVSYQGVRVEVVSLRSMTSESLINVADCFVDLDSIKQDIQKNSHSGFSYR
ncbi:MAG: NYN domain-containing protein [Calothrix sp. MO_167.B12]|nr:NYN domain-containing protein [Calothrix sp. MO_167.B12]